MELRRFITDGLRWLLASVLIYIALFTFLGRVDHAGKPWIYTLDPLQHWKGGSSWQRFEEFEHRAGEHFAVMIIGSSHAYRGYDPAIFQREGYSAFNLGSSAQSPMNSYYVLKHHVSSANTGVLILDAYMSMMNSDAMESTADLTMNMSRGPAAWDMALGTHDPRAANMIALRGMLTADSVMYLDPEYRPGGYCRNADSLRKPLTFDLSRGFDPDELQTRYFKRILEHCKAEGIPVVIVTHPAPKASNRAKHLDFARWIHEVADPLGIRYFDFAFDHGLPLDDLDHFYDRNHLNAAGVEIFNAALIDRMEREGVLPPRSK